MSMSERIHRDVLGEIWFLRSQETLDFLQDTVSDLTVWPRLSRHTAGECVIWGARGVLVLTVWPQLSRCIAGECVIWGAQGVPIYLSTCEGSGLSHLQYEHHVLTSWGRKQTLPCSRKNTPSKVETCWAYKEAPFFFLFFCHRNSSFQNTLQYNFINAH